MADSKTIGLCDEVAEYIRKHDWGRPLTVDRVYTPEYEVDEARETVQVFVFPAPVSLNITNRAAGGADRYQVSVAVMSRVKRRSDKDEAVALAEDIADQMRRQQTETVPGIVTSIEWQPNFDPEMMRQRSVFVSGMQLSITMRS